MRLAMVPFILLLASPVLLAQPADCVALTFDEPGVLPSANGFLFQGTATETSVFSVSAGKLHLNTLGTRTVAFYVLPGAYDPARDYELEFEAKVVTVTGPFGLDFEVSDDDFDFELGLMENGTFLPPPGRPFLPLGTAAGEAHVYKMTSSAGSSTYQLFVDGNLTFTGAIAPGGDPANRLAFGDGTGDADSMAEIDNLRFCQPRAALSVVIDIKPGSDPNTIQRRSHGRVPVALLGSSTFSVLDVDLATVMFAGAPVATHPNGSFMAGIEDVNGDGLDDLVLHFATDLLLLPPGDTTATLSGQLGNGTAIIGQDSVRILP